MCLETSADEILATLQMAPIRHVRDLSQFCELEGLVTACPPWADLPAWELWYLYAFDDALLGQILSSPHLANLRTLILHHDRNGNLADERIIAEALVSEEPAGAAEGPVLRDVPQPGRRPAAASCGTFRVSARSEEVRLNAPYRLRTSTAGSSRASSRATTKHPVVLTTA